LGVHQLFVGQTELEKWSAGCNRFASNRVNPGHDAGHRSRDLDLRSSRTFLDHRRHIDGAIEVSRFDRHKLKADVLLPLFAQSQRCRLGGSGMVVVGMGVRFAVSVFGSVLVAFAVVQAFLRNGQELADFGKPHIAGKIPGNDSRDGNYHGRPNRELTSRESRKPCLIHTFRCLRTIC